MKTKIAMIGLGAIGSVISKALLTHKNNKLHYFTRTAKPEIKIAYKEQRISIPISCNVHQNPSIPFDWVIICLKAYQYENAKPLFASLIAPTSKVAVIRNGIHLKEVIQGFVSPDSILACTIDCPTQPRGDGYYWQLKHPVITTKKSSLANDFSPLFPPEEMTINQVTDFKTENWKKLIESSALGAIQCLTGQTCHVFQDPKIVAIYIQLIKEGIAVACANGAKIEENFEDTLILKLDTYPKGKGSSMLTDRLRGNPIELQAKNGAIKKMAKIKGLITPLNDLFCTLIEKINSDETFN